MVTSATIYRAVEMSETGIHTEAIDMINYDNNFFFGAIFVHICVIYFGLFYQAGKNKPLL